MDLTKLSLDEFMCTGSQQLDLQESTSDGLLTVVASYVGPMIRRLQGEYKIHQVRGCQTNVLAIFNSSVVGAYCDEALVVHQDHRRRGLAVEMILDAVKYRPLPTHRVLTKEGKAALEKAWHVANGLG